MYTFSPVREHLEVVDLNIENPLPQSTDFTQAMNIYKTNYVMYRTTGNSAYKTAYENAERWIQAYLAEQNQKITTSAQTINQFVQDYTTANPDLVNLKNQFTSIRTEGPKLEDKYIQIKRVKEEASGEIDNTSYYIKGGIVAGLLGIVVAMSIF